MPASMPASVSAAMAAFMLSLSTALPLQTLGIVSSQIAVTVFSAGTLSSAIVVSGVAESLAIFLELLLDFLALLWAVGIAVGLLVLVPALDGHVIAVLVASALLECVSAWLLPSMSPLTFMGASFMPPATMSAVLLYEG